MPLRFEVLDFINNKVRMALFVQWYNFIAFDLNSDEKIILKNEVG